VWLTLRDPNLSALTLHRTDTYPRKMVLLLRVQYRKAVLTIGQQGEREYNGGFYLLTSRGYLELSREGGRSIKIKAGVRNGWHSGISSPMDIVSEPLSLEEIYEIDQILGSSDIKVSWNIDAYGFLDEEMYRKYGLNPGLVVRINIGRVGYFVITRQEFVRNILEPADMLKRLFVEVVVEPVDDDLLSRITDADVREAIRILVDKQRMLYEALNKLYRARTASEYRDVISEVRRAIEGIVLGTSAGNKIASALEKAFKGLNIAYETEAGALDEVVNELKEVILGMKSFTNAIYGYASSLGIHATEIEKPKKLYEPRPYRHDAEFAVLQAMLFLNYLIRVLKHYASRV